MIENISTEEVDKYRIIGTFKRSPYVLFKRFYVSSPYWNLNDLSPRDYKSLCKKAYIHTEKRLVKLLRKQNITSFQLEWKTAGEFGDLVAKAGVNARFDDTKCIAIYINMDNPPSIELPKSLCGFILLPLLLSENETKPVSE